MPKLETYTASPSGIQGPIQGRRVDASDISSGRSVAGLGNAVVGTGETVHNIHEQKDIYEQQKYVEKSRAHWLQRFEDLKKTAPEDGAGFSETFQKEYDTWREKSQGSAASDKGQHFLDMQLESMRTNFLGDAISFQARAKGKKEISELSNIIQTNENLVTADPSKRDMITQSTENLIRNNPYWKSQQQAEQMVTEVKTKFWDKALEGNIVNIETRDGVQVKDVDNILAELKDEKKGWIKNASSSAYSTAVKKLENFKDNLVVKKQQQLVLDFNDDMKQIKETGVDHGRYTEDWIRSNIVDPDQAERMVKIQAQSRAMGQAFSFVKDKPVTEVSAYIEDLEKKRLTTTDYGLVNSEYEMAVHAFQRRQEVMSKDPVGYSMNVSSAVRTQYEQFSKAPTPENAAKYAETVIAEQRRLNPGMVSSPRILSAAQVGQVEAQLAAIPGNEQGVSQAVDTLQAQQALWGKHWPQAVRDLRAGKAINDTQYIAASMMDKPQYRYIAEDLMRASQVDEEKLVRSIPGEGASKRAREAAQGALAPLRRTLAVNGVNGGLQTYQAYEDSLAKLILFKGAQTGQDMSKNAQDYAKKIVLDGYEFKETYRVPVNQDSSLVERGLHVFKQRDLANQDYVLPAYDPTIKPEDAKKQYVDSLKAFGTFVNAGDDNGGLRLLDGRGNQVMIKQGGKQVPLRWSWAEVQSMWGPEKQIEQELMHIQNPSEKERIRKERLKQLAPK